MPTTTKKKKSVRFGPTPDSPVQVTLLGPSSLIPCSSEMPPEDKIKLWWSPHELTLISREAKLIAKGIRTRSYRKSNKPTSYARVVRQVYMECSETGSTSRTTTYNLQQWHSLGHSRRGLELYSVPIPERVQAKESVLRHVVVSMQRYYLNEKSIVDHDSRAKLIRVASLCHSKVAQVLARTMAAADAMAALDEYQTPSVVMYQVMDMCGDKLVPPSRRYEPDDDKPQVIKYSTYRSKKTRAKETHRSATTKS